MCAGTTALLPCCHSFCRACLLRLIDTDAGGAPASQGVLAVTCFECPECGAVAAPRSVEGIRSLPPDALLETQLAATALSPARPARPADCSEHGNRTVNEFCEDCQQAGCGECMRGGHTAHAVVALDGALVASKRDAVQAAAQTAHLMAGRAERRLGDISSRLEEIRERQDQMIEDVNRTHRSILALLESKRLALHQHVKGLYAAERALYEDEAARIQRRIQSVRAPLSVAQELLTVPSTLSLVDLIGMETIVVRRVARLASESGDNEDDDAVLLPVAKHDLVLHPHLEEVVEYFGQVVTVAHADHAFLDGPGLTNPSAGVPAEFTIRCHDRNGRALTMGGASISVQWGDPNFQSTQNTRFDVVDNRNGTYTVSYATPTLSGARMLEVLVNGHPANGSPFSVHIKPPPGAFLAGPNYSLNPSKTIAKAQTSGWNKTVIGPKLVDGDVRYMRIRAVSSGRAANMMIGLAPPTIDQRGEQNFKKCGWYFACDSLRLCSQDGQLYDDFGCRRSGFFEGQEVGIQLHENGDVHVFVGGNDWGKAFSVPPRRTYHFVVLLCDARDEVELI